jgi:hypothetical protein
VCETRGAFFHRNARFGKKGGSFLLPSIFQEEEMKRFWLVLLSLGLIVAFSTTSFAQVDVKFSGEFIAGGMYLDKTALNKDRNWVPISYGKHALDIVPAGWREPNSPSTAFYFQRLRLNAVFTVSPGLMLTTRMDIMERAWGASRSSGSVATYADGSPIAIGTASAALDTLSAGTRAENENIAIDLAYLTYVSPIGMFSAGYMIDGAWGTPFGNSSLPTGKVTYTIKQGPVIIGLQTGKNTEKSRTAINPVGQTDLDSSFYTAFGVFAWKTGQVALLYKYINDKSNRTLVGPWYYAANINYQQAVHILSPYAKVKVGPVALEAQLYYVNGKIKFEDTADPTLIGALRLAPEVDVQNWSAYVDALADLGMFYAGGTLAYVSGNDPDTLDKAEGGLLSGGLDWNPTLILFNNDLNYWAGSQAGYDGTTAGGRLTNAYFAQVRGGVRPIDKLDIGLSVSYAHADKTLTVAHVDRDYGWEVDATATYKITNNLSYMLGAGYLFTGNYYKGVAAGVGQTKDLENNYLVINKLTLTF